LSLKISYYESVIVTFHLEQEKLVALSHQTCVPLLTADWSNFGLTSLTQNITWPGAS